MIEYKKASLDEGTVKQLIELSLIWEKEDITAGLRGNTREDLMEPCYIALDRDKIVGYVFGKYYQNEKKNSYIEIGKECFDIVEIFVLKEYRSQGIGKRLIELIEEEVKEKADYITLCTSTRDYEKILRFYHEKVDMTFYYAEMVKKIK